MKLNLSVSSASIAGEFVIFLFNVRTMTHILHLNTRSNAQHEALDEFYKGIVELADRFAESSIGRFKTITWPDLLGDGVVTVSELEPIRYLNQVKAGVEKAVELFDDMEDLENIIAEILELTTSTLYKLEQLS
jgi:DNA-binding ferritin-like protein